MKENKNKQSGKSSRESEINDLVVAKRNDISKILMTSGFTLFHQLEKGITSVMKGTSKSRWQFSECELLEDESQSDHRSIIMSGEYKQWGCTLFFHSVWAPTHPIRSATSVTGLLFIDKVEICVYYNRLFKDRISSELTITPRILVNCVDGLDVIASLFEPDNS